MEPIYTPHNTKPAYQLDWGLTLFWREAAPPDHDWLSALQRDCEPDGVRVLKHRTTANGASQFFVSTKPHVAPSAMIRAVKGRLQHLIRQQTPRAFRRNYCVRSIGSATRSVVEDYVAKQLGHHPMADPRVQELLARFQKTNPEVDLSRPSFSTHGEYWYNLHLVIVNEGRWMEVRESILEGLSRTIEAAAAKHGDRLSRVSIVPDHIHVTMGCPIDRSPEEIALSYLNNCAYASARRPIAVDFAH